MPHCIRHSEFHEVRGYHTEKLQPGNYSYRVRATSLAGPGPWTAFKYFHVVDKGWYLSIISYENFYEHLGGKNFYISKIKM